MAGFAAGTLVYLAADAWLSRDSAANAMRRSGHAAASGRPTTMSRDDSEAALREAMAAGLAVDCARMTVREWIEEDGRAWRERDAEAAARLFTEHAVYARARSASRASGATASAPAGSRRLGRRRESTCASASRSSTGGAAVERWPTLEAGGEEITLPGILVLRFAADGRCEELRECWHVETGRREPHDGWGR